MHEGVCLYVAVTAAWIDVVVHWATDLKLGYCGDTFWLDYGTCCDVGMYLYLTFWSCCFLGNERVC